MIENKQTYIAIDQMIESIRSYSPDQNGEGIKFDLDRSEAADKLSNWIRENYMVRNEPAFVRIGGTA